MENALYYTLSTIAQTLAGALAVLVAFVLFRLSKLDEAISNGQSLLMSWEPTPRYTESWSILRDQGPEALRDHMKDYRSLHEAGLWLTCWGAHASWRSRSEITPPFYWAVGSTVTNIALCFSSLPFTPRIACSRWATGIILVLTVGLGIVCLGLYARLIVSMVRVPAD